MVLWIIGAVVLAVVVWAFWPRRRGIADRELELKRSITEGEAGRNDRTPGGSAGFPPGF